LLGFASYFEDLFRSDPDKWVGLLSIQNDKAFISRDMAKKALVGLLLLNKFTPKGIIQKQC
jgi:hypothetical protein